MGSVLEESYGRTQHDMAMLTNVLSMGLSNCPYPQGTDMFQGWNKQREKLIKSLLTNIFRQSTKTNVLQVKGCGVTVHTPTGSFSFPPGYVDRMWFGTFPYTTNVTVRNQMGMMGNFVNVGNPEFA